MKNYEYKFVNESTIKELEEICEDGHADALTAYGKECVNASLTKYKNDVAIITIIATVTLGVVSWGISEFAKAIEERRRLKRSIEEFNKKYNNDTY